MLMLFQYRSILLTVFLTTIFAVCSFAQENYSVIGDVLLEDQNFHELTISLQNENSVTPVSVTPTGRFFVNLNWNENYWFCFSKPGYVTKVIEFSTRIPDKQSHVIEPYLLQVRLFSVFKGVDTVFFKKPVAKIYFDAELNDFTDDRDYTLQVLYEIEQMRKRGNASTVEKKNEAVLPIAANKTKQEVIRNAKKDQGTSLKKTPSGQNKTSFQVNNTSASDQQPTLLLPPLKGSYPDGKTIEEFTVKDKKITRVIMCKSGDQKVFLKVVHRWGGVFYFLDESPLAFRSISRDLYERQTLVNAEDHAHKTN